LIDFSIWILREIIPFHVSLGNQYIFTALVAGMWVLFSMEYNYNNGIIFLDFDGAPLPYNMRHRHPLLSTSLAEFWGIRWNPVIGKLLQDAFYKPLRRLGTPRALCIMTCFLGSSILHSFPQYISTWNVMDGLMMGSFFLLQGTLVLFEYKILTVLKLDKYSAKHTPSPGGAHMRAKFQLAAEIFIITLILYLYYIMNEKLCITTIDIFASLSFIFIAFSSVLLVHAQAEGFDSVISASRSIFILCGWLWTVCCVIISMPLFSIPVFHAIENFYERSIFVGPLVRSFVKSL
jgi:hypothetical protein